LHSVISPSIRRSNNRGVIVVFQLQT